MKSIGFKNFRKFVEFPKLDFNDITLMVGKNNSGKSTLVKAVLLVIDYLKNQQNQQFSFSTTNVKDVNIVSFDRARSKFQPDDVIYFSCLIAPHYDVHIKIGGDKESISGSVLEVEVKDTKQGLAFLFNYATSTVSVAKNKTSKEIFVDRLKDADEELKLLSTKIEELSKQLGGAELFREIDSLNKERERLEAQMQSEETNSSSIFALQYEVDLGRSPSNENFEDYVAEFFNENENEKRLLINEREKSDFTEAQNEKLEEVNLVLESKSEIIDSIAHFVKSINTHHYYYWSAETQKQSALFSIRDENNALAVAIHDFCKLKIERGSEEWLFVENELRGFDIGENFELIPHVGEAYECNIIEETQCRISLADKGMGTIQLMTLLFRLAAIIRKHQRQIKFDGESITFDGEPSYYGDNVTLIIEEPELNLHPSLQSRLTTLFESINKRYGIKFIIETHSEYLIRQSQVLVNIAKYKDTTDIIENNVFETYYFPSENTPYKMRYRLDGKFSNEFGTGFFDVAADLAFEIF